MKIKFKATQWFIVDMKIAIANYKEKHMGKLTKPKWDQVFWLSADVLIARATKQVVEWAAKNNYYKRVRTQQTAIPTHKNECI